MDDYNIRPYGTAAIPPYWYIESYDDENRRDIISPPQPFTTTFFVNKRISGLTDPCGYFMMYLPSYCTTLQSSIGFNSAAHSLPITIKCGRKRSDYVEIDTSKEGKIVLLVHQVLSEFFKLELVFDVDKVITPDVKEIIDIVSVPKVPTQEQMLENDMTTTVCQYRSGQILFYRPRGANTIIVLNQNRETLNSRESLCRRDDSASVSSEGQVQVINNGIYTVNGKKEISGTPDLSKGILAVKYDNQEATFVHYESFDKLQEAQIESRGYIAPLYEFSEDKILRYDFRNCPTALMYRK